MLCQLIFVTILLAFASKGHVLLQHTRPLELWHLLSHSSAFSLLLMASEAELSCYLSAGSPLPPCPPSFLLSSPELHFALPANSCPYLASALACLPLCKNLLLLILISQPAVLAVAAHTPGHLPGRKNSLSPWPTFPGYLCPSWPVRGGTHCPFDSSEPPNFLLQSPND